MVGSINVGFGTSNLCFGGPDYKTLYITGSGQVRSMPVLVAGAVSLKTNSPAVELEGGLVDGKLVISWPEEETGFALQETGDVASSENWENSVRTPEVSDGKNNLEVDPATEGDSRYFRLIQE